MLTRPVIQSVRYNVNNPRLAITKSGRERCHVDQAYDAMNKATMYGGSVLNVMGKRVPKSESRRDQEEGGELDSHEKVSPEEIKRREVSWTLTKTLVQKRSRAGRWRWAIERERV